VFQDDGATIHRAEVSLRAVEETFTSRVDHTTQAPKMADVWPIENVWSILKGKVAEKECSNDPQLKKPSLQHGERLTMIRLYVDI